MKNPFLILMLFAFSGHSYGCQCGPTYSVKQEFKESGIIAKVVVIEILDPIDPIVQIVSTNNDTLIKRPVFGYAKKVVISKMYKGDLWNDTVIVPGNNTTCELHLELGKTYLIYGQIVNNEIVTNSCTRSGNFQNHTDLAYLERKQKRMKR